MSKIKTQKKCELKLNEVRSLILIKITTSLKGGKQMLGLTGLVV